VGERMGRGLGLDRRVAAVDNGPQAAGTGGQHRSALHGFKTEEGEPLTGGTAQHSTG
jgi:hypothetical protein